MIFFLHGADTYRSRQKLREIKDKFKKEIDVSGLNLNVIDGAKANMDDINRAISSMPFLAKRRMVVIENVFANKNEEFFTALVPFLQKLTINTSDSSAIIVFQDAIAEAPKKSSASNELWQLLNKEKFNLAFDLLAGSALLAWVSEEFKAQGVQIGVTEANYLVSATGSDSWLLKSEIGKLAAYAHAYARAVQAHSKSTNQAQITTQQIDLMVNAQFDDNIFKLVDAVSQAQKTQALTLLNDQLENGVNEMYLLSMINRCFRLLTLVKATPAASQAKLGLHAFVLKKTLSQSQRYTMAQLQNVYQRLVRLDEQIKTGFGKPALLLDLFVASV